MGIAHTRWATHGEKNILNAHPHLSMCGQFAIVHNGILENYSSLKTLLQEKGFHFLSQTDSEVIAHLLSLYAQTLPILECIHKLNQTLRGSWAIAILCIQSQEIYCTRQGCPLLVGYNEDHAMVVSEKSGFCQRITHYNVLNNLDVCKLSRNDQGIQVTTLDSYPVQILTHRETNDLSPAPYPHWTLKEIHEQPASSLRAMEGRVYPNFVYLQELQPVLEYLLKIEHLIVLGCGTSYFAGQYGVFFLKELGDFTTVQAFEGAEFGEQDIPKKGKTALLLLSQSGETKDLHRCIAIGRQHGLNILGLVNVEDSMIAREVDCVCYLKAGREVGVASTKTYTSQVICLAILSIWFAQQKRIHESKRMKYLDDLNKLSQDISSTLQENVTKMESIVSLFKDKEHCFLLGKGPSESVAKEGALKIKEISYLHSEGYATSSLKHGPFSLLNEHFPVILLDSPKSENAYQEIHSRHAPVVWISTTEHDEPTLRIGENQTFGPLLAIIPLQLLAYHLSIAKELDPDFPRNLAKVVTVE
jgi:glucosamine--fructose-6-phosphate aminotransferase (isomerizing)